MQKFADQKYTNNRTVKKQTDKEPDDRSKTSSESNRSIHHIKEIKKIEKKQTLHGNSKHKQEEERVHN